MDNRKIEAAGCMADLTRWYRDLHQIPEIGLNLPETSAYIKKELTAMGYQPVTLCNHSLCALLAGSRPGPTILLRADMDALPMEEINDLPFRSKKKNAAHMCGHDSHMAMLLGAAKLLKARQTELAGNVKFMFQAGEEGFNGALEMVQAGILENPKVDAAMALHCLCGDRYPAGTMLCAVDGPAKASADTFSIRVYGTGCHGAMPETGVDVINILCHIQNNLQTIVSREISCFAPAVLSICHIDAGSAANILPEEGMMEGTIRTFDEAVRQKIKQRLSEIADATAAQFGGRAEVLYADCLGATINDTNLAAELFSYVKDLLGPEQTDVIGPIMGAEDFSEVSSRVPTVYMDLSFGSIKEGYPHRVHSPYFRINEEALPVGAACFAECAMRYLETHGKKGADSAS